MWPLIIPMIFNAVRTVEGVVQGRRRGKTKKDIAVQMIGTALQALAKAGDIASVPSPEEIAQQVDGAHKQLEVTGALGGTGTSTRIILTVSELAELIKANTTPILTLPPGKR